VISTFSGIGKVLTPAERRGALKEIQNSRERRHKPGLASISAAIPTVGRSAPFPIDRWCVTCADIMITFNLTSLSRFGGRTVDDLPNVQSYMARIAQRPAYVKAMKIAGPGATKPTA